MDAGAAKEQICLKVANVCDEAIRVGEAMLRTISGAHDQSNATIEFTFPALQADEAQLLVNGREKTLSQGDGGGQGMEPFFDLPQRKTTEARQGEAARMAAANGLALHPVDDVVEASAKAQADKLKKILKLNGFKDFGLPLE